MKNQLITRLLPVLLLAATSTALAGPAVRQDVVIRRGTATGDGPRFNLKGEGPGPVEMEKVAYLGVETMPVDPTVAAQLGLPVGTGVVVRRVAEGSPAAGLLQPHDILTKLDDQILVNRQQLTVLVRNHQAGDEVKLTYVRGGKEATAKARLGTHEVPKLADAPPPFRHLLGGDEAEAGPMLFPGSAPGLPPGPDAGEVMRLIGGDRLHWFAQPRVHVFKRPGGGGPTILDLPSGSFVFSDEQGSVEVNSAQGQRELTVKNRQGEVTFKGPISTPEESEKLPSEVKARLEVIGGAELGTEAGEVKIETKVLRPATKTRSMLPPLRSGAGRQTF